MPNTNIPGVDIVQYEGRKPQLRTYVVPTSDSTAIGLGAFVKYTGSTTTYSGDLQFYPIVAKAGSADTICGIVVGVLPVTGDSLTYRAASTERLVTVDVDPDVRFAIPMSGALVAADIGNNANIVDATTVNGLGIQQEALLTSSINTTSTLQVRIEAVEQRNDNAAVDSYTRVVCKINRHFFADNTAGV
jgi:hypothetical protein